MKQSIKNSVFVEIFFWAFFLMEFGLLVQTVIFEPKNVGMILFWSLASGVFLGVIFLLRWQPTKKLIYLTGGQKSIEFFQEKPSTKEVTEFIGELQIRIKNAYINEYLKWEDSTPKEQKIGQLDWLKRIKILEDEDYDELIDKINKGKSIGFK